MFMYLLSAFFMQCIVRAPKYQTAGMSSMNYFVSLINIWMLIKFHLKLLFIITDNNTHLTNHRSLPDRIILGQFETIKIPD